MFQKRIPTALVAFTLLFALAQPGLGQRVSAGFLANNPQIFPIGSMVSTEQVDENAELTLGSVPDIVWVRLDLPDLAAQERVVLHASLVTGSFVLCDFWSEPFPYENWTGGRLGARTLTNNEIWQRVENGVIGQDGARTVYATIEEFLQYVEGGNLNQGLYSFALEVFDDAGSLLGMYTDSRMFYNPTRPRPLAPMLGDEVIGYPVQLAWSWNGGPVPLDDWKIVLVQMREGESPEDAITTRSPSRVLYEGPPMSSRAHLYTGSWGEERPIEFAAPEENSAGGVRVAWAVEVDVSTIIPGETVRFQSSASSFLFRQESSAAPNRDPAISWLLSYLASLGNQQLLEAFRDWEYQGAIYNGVSIDNPQELISLLLSPDTVIRDIRIEEGP